MVFNPNIYMQAAQQRQQSDSNLLNALQNAAKMYQQGQDKKEARLAEERKRVQQIASKDQAAKKDPSNILAQAVQYGEESLTPEQKAIFQASQMEKAAKVSLDPLGRAYNPYQMISLDGEPNVKTVSAPSVSQVGATIPSDLSGIAASPEGQKLRLKSVLEEEREKRKFEFDKQKNLPKVNSAFRSMTLDVENIGKTIDKAIDQSNKLNTGLASQAPMGIGYATGAKDLESTLSTIKADSALGRLTELKAAGGTLGATSEKELKMLQDARVALEQSQTEEQLDENLAQYKENRKKALENVAEAYKEDYGTYPEGYKPEESEESKFREGQTATNPSTGERMIFEGGKWRKI